VNIFIFNGWKVARQIPKWIHGFDAFIKFMDDNLNHDSKSEYNSEEDVNDDDKKNIEYEVDDEEEVEEQARFFHVGGVGSRCLRRREEATGLD
jgi:hypothetical protein